MLNNNRAPLSATDQSSRQVGSVIHDTPGVNNVNDAMYKWLDFLRYRMNYRPRTLDGYKCYFKKFAKENPYLKTLDDFNTANIGRIEWWFEKRAMEYSITDHNLHVTALRSFLRYFWERNLIDLKPDFLRYGREDDKKIEVLAPEDMLKILSVTECLRDRVIMRLMYESGLRIGEVRNCDSEDFYDDNTFLIKGKGGKNRKGFLYPDQAEELRRLIEKTGPGALFKSTRSCQYGKIGSRISLDGIRDALDKWESEAGFDCKKIWPHMYRHSFATNRLRAGTSLRSIQIMMGHQFITTTQKYLHVADPELKKEFLSNRALDNMVKVC